jgi:hypothetical protein
LDIKEGDPFLEMVFKAREFENMIDIEEMNAPTDKQKWVSGELVFRMPRPTDHTHQKPQSFAKWSISSS